MPYTVIHVFPSCCSMISFALRRLLADLKISKAPLPVPVEGPNSASIRTEETLS